VTAVSPIVTLLGGTNGCPNNARSDAGRVPVCEQAGRHEWGRAISDENCVTGRLPARMRPRLYETAWLGMPEISVVAPVYNQRAETLVELVQRLSSAIATITGDFEIVLIDDGQRQRCLADDSQAGAEQSGRKRFRLARNFGQHVAITAGLDYADGKLGGGDGCRSAGSPGSHSRTLCQSPQGYDVVFVNRVQRPESVVYRMTAACFYFILNALSGQNFNRLQGTFPSFRADVVRSFRLVREKLRFYGGILRWVGFRHGSINAQHAAPDAGQTSYSFVKRVRFALSVILGFSTRLLYISIAIGLTMAVASSVRPGLSSEKTALSRISGAGLAERHDRTLLHGRSDQRGHRLDWHLYRADSPANQGPAALHRRRGYSRDAACGFS